MLLQLRQADEQVLHVTERFAMIVPGSLAAPIAQVLLSCVAPEECAASHSASRARLSRRASSIRARAHSLSAIATIAGKAQATITTTATLHFSARVPDGASYNPRNHSGTKCALSGSASTPSSTATSASLSFGSEPFSVR